MKTRFIPQVDIMLGIEGPVVAQNQLLFASYWMKVRKGNSQDFDSWIVAAASRSFYQAILASGASIYEYTGGLLHYRTLTIDGRVTFMGSNNMDLRSFDLNYENDILLQDDAIT